MSPAFLRRRAATHLPLKLGLTGALLAGVSLGYFGVQQLRLAAPLAVAETWLDSGLDRAVPFDPRWTGVYLSLYLLMPILPWATADRPSLLRYGRGFAALAGVSFLLFALLPVESPRPDTLPDQGLYRLLTSVDGTLNAFPSLHASLATYSWLYGRRLLAAAPAGARLALLGGFSLWVALIFYSTLATRQHWAVDLAAGALLAWACDRWAWRGSTRAAASTWIELTRREAP